MPATEINRKKFFFGVFLFWLTNVLIGFHGYSFPLWHEYLDGQKKAKEVIMGGLREVRGDDTYLELPLILSQIPNQFQTINPNIGFGQTMLGPVRAPSYSPVSLFRPSSWGFFIGADFGLAWMWWFYVLGLFCVCTWFFYFLLRKQHFEWAALGAFCVIYSPFFRFWSFHKAEIFLHGMVSLLALLALVFEKSKRRIFFAGLIAGWSASCFVLDHIYPPFQVTLGYAIFLVAAFLIIDRRRELSLKLLGWRLFALVLAVSILGFAGFSFLRGTGEALALINQTVYPGMRFSLGGGKNLLDFLTSHFFVARYVTQWGSLSNVCEASAFLFFTPLILGLWSFDNVKNKKKPRVITLLLFAYIVFALYFAGLGIPAWLSHYTLFYKVPSNRLLMGLGFIEFFLLFMYLRDPLSLSRRVRYLVLGNWILFLGLAGLKIMKLVPELTFTRWIFYLGVNGFLGYLLVQENRKREFLLALSAVYFIYTTSFNPLVFRGTDYVYEHPLSKKVVELDKAHPQKSQWLVFSNNIPPGSLLRMLGVRSLDGYFCPPPFKILKFLDPQGKYHLQYNQCAYFIFRPGMEKELEINSSPGMVIFTVKPNAPELMNLGIDYFLVEGPEFSIFDATPTLKQVFQHGNYRIYRLGN